MTKSGSFFVTLMLIAIAQSREQNEAARVASDESKKTHLVHHKNEEEALIARKEAANTARVSALAEASSGIETFATSLNALLSGGSLYTQPTSSDAIKVDHSILNPALIITIREPWPSAPSNAHQGSAR